MRNAVDLPCAYRKIVAVDLAFYLPGRFGRTQAGLSGCEEPKGGKRGDEAIWRSLNHRLDLAGYGVFSGQLRAPLAAQTRSPRVRKYAQRDEPE
jgi:hypothetical protein